jgi:mannose PTS system EIID component
MIALSRWTRLRVFLRSFAVQGSWNYRTLIGSGFAYALLPGLREVYAGRPRDLRAAVDRHSGLFNSHPYLAPMALGAVLRLEANGEADIVVERFKAAIRGSLGMIGDRLVWTGLRPVCLLVAIVLVFAGAGWLAAGLAFLISYNAAHIFIRVWAFRLGWREGKAVAERFRHSRIGPAHRLLAWIGAFLVGVALPLALASVALTPSGEGRWTWGAAALLAALAGLHWGPGVRGIAVILLAGFAVLGLAVGVLA